MDYAFVPGAGDRALETLADVYRKRPQTTLVSEVSQGSTLAGFLETLRELITLLHNSQMDDLLIGAHGSAWGQLQLTLNDGAPAIATYESVETATTIKIPPGVGSTNSNVRLGSCSLGSSKPFLTVLKKALGNPKSVSAPRFIHEFAPSPRRFLQPTDLYEVLMYEFFVVGKRLGRDPFATRDEVKSAFTGAGFKFYDDTTAVAAYNWDNWIPPEAQLELAPAIRQQIDFDLPLPLVVGGSWLSNHESITQKIAGNAVPAGEDAQRALLQTALAQDNRYTANHPFPVYKRYGYQKLEDYVNGWNWKVTTLPNNQLQYLGTRYTYELWIPVMDLQGGTLMVNIYPEDDPPIIRFTETTHPELFGIV
jgi:hypothetical protein